MISKILNTLIVILISGLTGCGGGSGDSDGTNTSDTPSNDINSVLSGQLYIGSEGDGPWILNIPTGHYRSIPGVQWEDNPNYHHRSKYSAYPSKDGTEFIETIRDCEHIGNLEYYSCLVIHNTQGEVVSSMRVPYDLHGPAKLSDDKMFIAVPVQYPYPENLPFEFKLTIFTRDGVMVDKSIHNIPISGFDWLPDNRLLYASDDALYATDIASAQAVKWIAFTEEEGKPDQLAISHIGDQLAFTLRTNTTVVSEHGTTWVVNLDGSRIVQLTNVPGTNDPNTGSDDPIINYPTWSPDGNWIAVIEGAVRNESPSTGGDALFKAHLFVVPSQGENIMLTEEVETQAILLQSYFEETYDWYDPSDGAPDLSNIFNIHSGGMKWIN